MSVSEASETGVYNTRMGIFAVYTKVRRAKPLWYTISVGTGMVWQLLKTVRLLFPAEWSCTQQSEFPQRWLWTALCVVRRALWMQAGCRGGLAGPLAVRGNPFWEMGSTNISSSLHKQKHDNTGRVSLVSLFMFTCFPIWVSVLTGPAVLPGLKGRCIPFPPSGQSIFCSVVSPQLPMLFPSA